MGLRFAEGIRAYLRTLAPGPKKDIREALRLIAEDPRNPDLDVKQLQKAGDLRFYRARVRKDYRIIYSPTGEHTYVWRIMHRSEGYDWLERLDP